MVKMILVNMPNDGKNVIMIITIIKTLFTEGTRPGFN